MDNLSGEQFILVCQDCHERDKLTTGCRDDFIKHLIIYSTSLHKLYCYICGKQKARLAKCNEYLKQAERNRLLARHSVTEN